MSELLNQAMVDALKPNPDRDTVVRDSQVTGFSLKVTPKGKKVYLLQYRSPDGRQRKLTLGTDPMTKEVDARMAAMTALRNLKNDGADPHTAKRRMMAVPSFGAAIDLYCTQFTTAGIEDEWKASTAAEYRRIFANYIPDKLKREPVNEVSHDDLYRVVQSVARRGTVMANNVRRRLNSFFEWCAINSRFIPVGTNPMRGIKGFKVKARKFVFDEKQLYRLSDVLAKAEVVEWLPAIEAIRLILHTGMRKQEALGLKWSEVDVARNLIHLEDAKTGARDVFLNEWAVEVLGRADAYRKVLGGGPYVFPSPRYRDRPIVGFQKIWDRLRKQAGIDTVRVHDLRHNQGGIGAELVSQVNVRDILGHKTMATTSRYMNPGNQANLAAAQTIGARIDAMMNPPNVTKIGGRK